MKVTAFLSSAAFVNTLLFTLVSSAPLGGTEGNNEVQSDQIKRDCIPIGVFYDDNSVKVPLEYIGDWTHLSNQGSGVKLGSLSYTGQPNAMVKTPNPFPAGEIHTADVTIWSTKKHDRGQFNVYVGAKLLGTGNQYTSATHETSTQRVFHRENVQIEGGLPIVIKNDKGAPYMAFDALEMEFCLY